MKLKELILEAGKDPMSEKPKGEELEALAHFLAICNLGYDDINKVKDGKFILNRKEFIATNFKGVVSSVNQQLRSMAESDSMMNDFEEEINAWRKDLSIQSRKKIAGAQKDLATIFAIVVHTGVD